jgi:hypothetical protein
VNCRRAAGAEPERERGAQERTIEDPHASGTTQIWRPYADDRRRPRVRITIGTGCDTGPASFRRAGESAA